MTSSAVAISVGGIVMPSATAVLMLMAKSNLVGCSTGISPGFVWGRFEAEPLGRSFDPVRLQHGLGVAGVSEDG
jgi:hypothetical protein